MSNAKAQRYFLSQFGISSASAAFCQSIIAWFLPYFSLLTFVIIHFLKKKTGISRREALEKMQCFASELRKDSQISNRQHSAKYKVHMR